MSAPAPIRPRRDERPPEGTALASLVASRLCHDLISPIGAIGNGVELLGMTGVAGPEMDLIGESVDGASARLRFMRIAFGAASTEQEVQPAHLNALLGSPHRGGKVAMSWSGTAPCSRADARIAFLLLMCIESAMPRGGRASASVSGGTLFVEGSGEMPRADPDLWSYLSTGMGAEAASGAVQFPLAALAAEEAGLRYAVELGPDSVSIRAVPWGAPVRA